MLDRLLKILAIVTLPFWGYGFGVATVQIVTLENLLTARFLSLMVGFAGFACLWKFFKRQLMFVFTFEHELTHLLVALLFLKIPREFVVSSDYSGHIKYSGSENFLITLAPYFLPTVSYLLIPVFWILPENYSLLGLGVLGGSLSFHIFSTRGEMQLKQPDFQKAGLLFSLIFLPAACLIFYGGVLALTLGGKKQFFSFWVQAFQESIKIFTL